MEIITLILVGALQIEVIVALLTLTKKDRTKRKFRNPVFIDTSVLMDGRISAAMTTGFVPETLVIPRSVLAELQLLADGSDSEKRSRARHGLDIAAWLQESSKDAQVFDDGKAAEGVDNQLLMLAKKYGGSIMTIDFNLNKVATAEGIQVLNINELAQQLRMNHLPGERVSLKIIQKGDNPHQGVGFLSDGTMVVVEQASSDINKQVEVEFVRSLQTAAGRMLFAKKIKKDTPQSRPKGTKAKKPVGRAKREKQPEDRLLDLVDKQSN